MVPRLHDSGAPPYWMHHAAAVGESVRRGSHFEEPVVLVAHSGAGALLPAIRRTLDSREVSAYVFVDAGIPAKDQSRLEAMYAEDPAWAVELANDLGTGGVFPSWTIEDLAAIIPDPDACRAVLEEIYPRGLDFFEEPIPVFAGWPDAPCGYVAFGDTYAAHVARARSEEWPVVVIEEAAHFHTVVDPAGVADAILKVL
ncbi:MAG: hypothetical protein NVSMB57_12730 [Actinomycetota bacterium]